MKKYFLLLFLISFNLFAQNLKWEKLDNNVEYAKIIQKSPLPQEMHLLRIPLDMVGLNFTTTLGNRRVWGLSTIPQMLHPKLREFSGEPIAAINGDFFIIREDTNLTGITSGTMVMDNEIITSSATGKSEYPWRRTFAVFCSRGGNDLKIKSEIKLDIKAIFNGEQAIPLAINCTPSSTSNILYTPRLGLAKGQKFDDNFYMTTRTVNTPEIILVSANNNLNSPLACFGKKRKMKVKEINLNGNSPIRPEQYILALSADSELVKNLKPGDFIELDFQGEKDIVGVKSLISGRSQLVKDGHAILCERKDRAPRSAIAFDKKYFYMFVADGRKKEQAIGVTFDEMAIFFEKLGCISAMDLDGGGSSMLYANGELINNLYTLPAVRRIANALVVVKNNN